MKRIFIISYILCDLSFVSCKKNTPGNASFTSQFDFDCDVPPISISVDTTIIVSSDISITDSRLENCDKASLKNLYVEIKAPSGQHFDFCEELHLWLSAPGIPEIDVVSVTKVSPTAIRIDFKVNDTDVAQYLRQKVMTARLKVKITKGFGATIKLHGNMVFNVQAKIK